MDAVNKFHVKPPSKLNNYKYAAAHPSTTHQLSTYAVTSTRKIRKISLLSPELAVFWIIHSGQKLQISAHIQRKSLF